MEAPLKPINRFFFNALRGATLALFLVGLTYLFAPWFQAESPERWPPRTPVFVRAFEVITAIWFFILGGCLGSFLNVVVYRLPRHMSLQGVSRCPFCKEPISASDNVPVFAWLKLRGTCRHCQLPIAARYPMVEFAVGLFVLVLAVTEVALGGANLSINSTKSLHGFTVNLIDPEWPLVVSLLWHTLIGLILLGLALITNDGSAIPRSMVAAGFLGIVAMTIFDKTTLYTVRNVPEQLSAGIALRDAALGAAAGWAVGLLLNWEWSHREATDRSLAWILAIAGGAFGWPIVLFCGVLTPFMELLCRWVAKADISPALILVGIVFSYLITGYPLLYPFLRTMPI